MLRVKLSFILLFLLSEIAFSCPPFLYDELGNVIDVKHKFSRIVSLAPAITETLFAIGAGSRVVGVTLFDNYPKEVERIFKVGDFSNPNLERVISVKPDLVLGISNLHFRLMKRIKEFGISCYTFKLYDTFEELYAMIDALGKITGNEREANLLIGELKERIKGIEDRGKALKAHPKVFLALWDSPLATIGRRSYIHEVIRIAGGFSITSDLEAYFPIYSIERLILGDPDIILVAGGNGGMGLSRDRLLKALSGKGIRAVERGNVYEIDGDLIFRLSPRIVEGIGILYKVFERWAGKD